VRIRYSFEDDWTDEPSIFFKVLSVRHSRQLNPIVSIPATAQKTGISASTVAKSLEHMKGLGIMREITGRKRHRLFVYETYLAILNEGTEPIR
jgi:hypothetical protein